MTFEEVRARFPEAYQDILASNEGDHEKARASWDQMYSEGYAEGYAEGVKEGVKQERSRCVRLIKLGEAAGNLPLAYKAIREGATVMGTADAMFASALNGLRGRLVLEQLRAPGGEP